eukprot:TRINITY_DN1729_c0_g1_i1.p1 TRINITY_DN1729_c0_g1~~TRINITY_DN1729_c0_g1_i1.p1  ORF type:complete len:384 (+),score=143.08 TRINITY_DN1729_c0_g1_i1:86-1237(+)
MDVFGWGGDPGERRHLIVELYGGRNITDGATVKSRSGPALKDPVVKLQLGSEKYQSDVVKQTMNPIWQQQFKFDITDISNAAVLVVTCEDHGITWNTFLGEVRVPIADHKDVSFEYSSQHWFALSNPKLRKKDGSPGEIALKIGTDQKGMVNKYMDGLDDRSVEDIYEEASVLAKESNESAHRSLNILYQTREIGSQTQGRLREQGMQIERMQGDMDTVHNNMAQSERKLRSIESVFGTLANQFTSSNNRSHKKKALADRKAVEMRKKADKTREKEKLKEWEATSKADKSNSRSRKRDQMIRRDPSVRQQMGVNEEEFYEYVDDTDRTLDQMDTVLDDLRGMATNIGTDLDVQNKRLDILHRDVSKAQPRIESAINRAGSIVK